MLVWRMAFLLDIFFSYEDEPIAMYSLVKKKKKKDLHCTQEKMYNSRRNALPQGKPGKPDPFTFFKPK